MSWSSVELIRVLHVDDDSDLVAVAAELLEAENLRFRVTTATSAEEAQELLSTHDIDCIVSDYDMPGTDGIDFLRSVREDHPDLPFILFTGKGSEEVASEAISAGVTDYLQKEPGTEPFALLANRIENAVKQYHATAKLQRYDQRLEVLLSDSHDIITVVDEGGTIQYISPAVENVAGFRTVELEGENAFEYVHPDDRAEVRAAFERVLSDADSTPVVEHRFETKAGAWQWLETTGTNQVENPEINGVVVNSRPITERKHQRRKIGRYETILETLPVGVAVLDDEATIEWVNEAFWTAIDTSEESVTNRPFMDLIEDGLVDPDIIEVYLDAVRTLLSSDTDEDRVTLEFEVDPPREDEIREYEGYIALQPLRDGEYNGTVNAFLDVTERKRRERELEQYKAAMETVPDGVFLLDEHGTMKRVNQAWASIVGYEPEELVGESFLKLVEDGVIDRRVIETYLNLLPELLSSETESEMARFTTRVVPPHDDREHVYEVHIGLLPYEEEFQGTAGVVRDVTEKVERRRRLERENERLEEFASIVSHDLRNPLNLLSGSLELAEESGDPDHFDRCRRAVERMERLIDDLLRLARQGESIEAVDPVNLASVVQTCWNRIESDGTTLRVETDTTIQADEERLKQLLENLFRNAIEHGGETVTITVDELENASGFYVADDGPGIPEDAREAVFEGGYSTSEKGTGFGLSIVNRIAEAHDWNINVAESEAGGARFEIAGVRLES